MYFLIHVKTKKFLIVHLFFFNQAFYIRKIKRSSVISVRNELYFGPIFS